MKTRSYTITQEEYDILNFLCQKKGQKISKMISSILIDYFKRDH